MYLKYIRDTFPFGEIHRGKLYSVHFEPNEKGDYNEHLTLISDVYECVTSEGMKELRSERVRELPLPLIYPVQMVQINGFLRISLGGYRRRSALHLINRDARDAFFSELRYLLYHRIEVRLEVM